MLRSYPYFGGCQYLIIDNWRRSRYTVSVEETWKDIPGTDYSVSDHGRVASRKRGGWRLMTLSVSNVGYQSISIFRHGEERRRCVHALVAEAFLGEKPTPKHQVNHKNGVKVDNRADNLEWVTVRENVQHGYDVLGHKAVFGEANGQSKLTSAQVREIRSRRESGELLRAIADDFGVNQSVVSRIAHRVRWGRLDNL